MLALLGLTAPAGALGCGYEELHDSRSGAARTPDLMALGALPVLLRAGRDVPSDVAVVGFDDSSATAACDPPLTTVRQPVEEMAAEMARLLLKQIGGPGGPSPSVVFSPTLVRRQSA